MSNRPIAILPDGAKPFETTLCSGNQWLGRSILMACTGNFLM
jgi:hypothetical protein